MPYIYLLCIILWTLVLDKMIKSYFTLCSLCSGNLHENYSIILLLVVFSVNASIKANLWQSLKYILCP